MQSLNVTFCYCELDKTQTKVPKEDIQQELYEGFTADVEQDVLKCTITFKTLTGNAKP